MLTITSTYGILNYDSISCTFLQQQFRKPTLFERRDNVFIIRFQPFVIFFSVIIKNKLHWKINNTSV